MGLLKIRTLQNLEGNSAYFYDKTNEHNVVIAIPDINWSVEIDVEEGSKDVEENLVMYLFNLMSETEAERLAHELTYMIFEKETDNEY